MDNTAKQGYVVVNVVVTDENRQQAIDEAQSCFDYYQNMSRFEPPKPRPFDGPLGDIKTDTDQAAYEEMVRTAKKHIIDGDIFQVVLSRTKMVPCADEPLDVYKRLRKLNPSPYMFYLKTPTYNPVGLESGVEPAVSAGLKIARWRSGQLPGPSRAVASMASWTWTSISVTRQNSRSTVRSWPST